MTARATLVILLLAAARPAAAQVDSAGARHGGARVDSVLAQDGIYARPYIFSAGRTSIGGYVEGNTNYAREDGVTEGFSMELRRFNIFLFSAIGSRIRMTSELEFEHGTEEISLETALIDFTVNPSLVFRAGIILSPIGAFNVRHDSPLYDIVDRPLVSTEIIPATLSEAGFGAHGRFFPGRGMTISYDAYLTQGLGEGVVANSTGRTRLADGKGGEQLGEDNNGRVAFAGRVALQHRRFGEFGLSYYGGVYNSYRVEGEVVDDARSVRLIALDLNTVVLGAHVRGEGAIALIDIPPALEELYGDRQRGFFLEAARPVFRPRIRGLPDAEVNLVARLDMVDYNWGTFSSTGDPIGDDTRAVTVGMSFRPAAGTVFKFNYRRSWIRDFVGNRPARAGAIQAGFATYF